MRLLKWKGLEVDPSKLSESFTVKPQILPESAEAFQESKKQEGSRYLLPRIEAIHAGTTRNYTRYPAEKLRGNKELKSGVHSWLYPYPKPVIFNHDTSTKPTGRVQSASFTEHTSTGKPGIVVIPKITDEETIDSILGGRLLTVSIGATTDAAICSVCGTNILEEYCGHWKGESYDGVTAEWIVGNVWFDELSWVNVPADQHAMITDMGEVSTAESFAFNGREIVDLGKSPTEWLVDSRVAVSEGLLAPKKKGDEIMPTAEEFQALKDKLEATEKELADVKEQLDKIQSEKKELEESLAQKDQELQEAKEALGAKEEELKSVQEQKAALEEEKAGVEVALEEQKKLYEEALQINARLAEEHRQTLVDAVAELRMSLGKESDREKAVEKLQGRTLESLKDSLADLLSETSSVPRPRLIEKVENPGADTDGKDDANKSEMKEQLNKEQVLKMLFGGKK